MAGSDVVEDGGPPVGYALVLPPGWRRVPLRSGTDGVIASIIAQAFRARSRDESATARRELHVRLRELVSAARAGNGLDLYLPVELQYGAVIGSSFVVGEVSFESVEPVDPSVLVARLAGATSARAVAVAGVPGARTERVVAADAERDLGVGSRRVDYVLPVPEDPARWVLVSFSTVGQGDPQDELVELSIELFDAIMSTFRWTGTRGLRSSTTRSMTSTA
ncbi:MAG TPA: hypothetical protein VMZ00_12430 [Sporichthya sp.]|nr:hypothetical protein [Sporichthya sp.]